MIVVAVVVVNSLLIGIVLLLFLKMCIQLKPKKKIVDNEKKYTNV